MRFRAKAASVAAAAVAIAGLGAGIAYASIPDGSGVIHACYQSPPPTHGANLQVIDTGAGGSCSGGMTALTWNQTGPQGPTGATGATGPAGPQATSVIVYTDVHYPGAQEGSAFETVTVDCPSGDKALNGGVDHTTNDAGAVSNGGASVVPADEDTSMSPDPSLPRPVNDGASWKMLVSVGFNSFTSAGITVTYYVICE
jgi:hypothetical protein